MSDALNATGKPIFFSYEPHLTVPIDWTRFVGNAWRTGHDIGSKFSSVFSDLAINNAWATVGGPGGFNDVSRSSLLSSRLECPPHFDSDVHFVTSSRTQ
jgi:hypothetical protein